MSATDNKSSSYLYSLEMIYTKTNGQTYTISKDKILTCIIEYQYDNKNMPIILMRVNLDKKIIDDMISNKTRTLILNILKFKDGNTMNIYKSVVKDEFYYFLDNNKNYLDDVDYAKDTKDSEDITKIITIGLMQKKSLDVNKILLNCVYRNTTNLDIILDKLKDMNVLIEPMDNKSVTNFIVTPVTTLTKFIQYVNSYYTLYPTQYRFFYDFNTTFLISSSGLGVPATFEKYNTVYLYISNVTTPESRIDGVVEDDTNKCYKIYIDTTNMNISEDNTTELSYNNIITVGASGEYSIVQLDNSTMNGDRYKVNRLLNDNMDSIDNIKSNIQDSSIVINIIKDNLESDIFTINKEYYIKAYDKLSDKNGLYVLSAKKEIYIRDADSFRINTILTLKKKL